MSNRPLYPNHSHRLPTRPSTTSIAHSSSFTSTSASAANANYTNGTTAAAVNNNNNHSTNSSNQNHGPSNGTTRRLALLLDQRALNAIAQKLWTVRTRLHLHTDGRIPSALELFAALRLYRERSDHERLVSSIKSKRSTSTSNKRQHHDHHAVENNRYPPNGPPLRLLVHLLRVCNAAYNMQDPVLFDSLLTSLNLPLPITQRSQADKFAPGYILVRDARHGGALLLCIRGSREAGDLLTNLSSDATKFLGGYAHEGIARSAREIHTTLRPILGTALLEGNGGPSGSGSSKSKMLEHGLIIFGHSLGGAVAAALTMLLRHKRPPRGEHPWVTHRLAHARCYAYAPPPFVDRYLMVRSQQLPITSLAYGLDVVPRLSPASVDRLLQRLAAYDFSPHISSAVSKLVRSVTSPVLGNRDAKVLASKAKDFKVDAKKIASVSAKVADAAQKVLQERQQQQQREQREQQLEQQLQRRRRKKPDGGDRGGDARGKKDGKERGSDRDRDGQRKRDSSIESGSRRAGAGDKDRENRGRDRRLSDSSRRKGESASGAKKKQRSVESQETGSTAKGGVGGGGWGETAVHAVLLATSALGAGVESHAVRYARNKDSRTQSLDVDSMRGKLQHGHAAAARKGTAQWKKGRAAEEDKGDNTMEEMFLAGEVWHIDKEFVAPEPNVEVGSWPMPTMKRASPDRFKDIEVSAWMLTDHESAVILKDLERMLALWWPPARRQPQRQPQQKPQPNMRLQSQQQQHHRQQLLHKEGQLSHRHQLKSQQQQEQLRMAHHVREAGGGSNSSNNSSRRGSWTDESGRWRGRKEPQEEYEGVFADEIHHRRRMAMMQERFGSLTASASDNAYAHATTNNSHVGATVTMNGYDKYGGRRHASPETRPYLPLAFDNDGQRRGSQLRTQGMGRRSMSATACHRSHNIVIPSYKSLDLDDIAIDGSGDVGHDEGCEPHTEDEQQREQKQQELSNEKAPRAENERRKRVMFASSPTDFADHNARRYVYGHGREQGLMAHSHQTLPTTFEYRGGSVVTSILGKGSKSTTLYDDEDDADAEDSEEVQYDDDEEEQEQEERVVRKFKYPSSALGQSHRVMPSYHYRYDNTEKDEHNSGGNEKRDDRGRDEEKEEEERWQQSVVQQVQQQEQDDGHEQEQAQGSQHKEEQKPKEKVMFHYSSATLSHSHQAVPTYRSSLRHSRDRAEGQGQGQTKKKVMFEYPSEAMSRSHQTMPTHPYHSSLKSTTGVGSGSAPGARSAATASETLRGDDHAELRDKREEEREQTKQRLEEKEVEEKTNKHAWGQRVIGRPYDHSDHYGMYSGHEEVLYEFESDYASGADAGGTSSSNSSVSATGCGGGVVVRTPTRASTMPPRVPKTSMTGKSSLQHRDSQQTLPSNSSLTTDEYTDAYTYIEDDDEEDVEEGRAV